MPTDLQQYDEVCRGLYADDRMPPGTRELALAMAWVLWRDRPRPSEGAPQWLRISELLAGPGSSANRCQELVCGDRPRYEPPSRRAGGRCEGPRMRPYRPRGLPGPVAEAMARDHDPHVCGDRTSATWIPEYDLDTGHLVRQRWFCRRHTEQATQVREQLGAAARPVADAIPNTGGLLPAHFTASDEDWVRVYRWASGDRWRPPYHGLCADDWPTPGAERIPRRPRLALIQGGGP